MLRRRVIAVCDGADAGFPAVPRREEELVPGRREDQRAISGAAGNGIGGRHRAGHPEHRDALPDAEHRSPEARRRAEPIRRCVERSGAHPPRSLLVAGDGDADGAGRGGRGTALAADVAVRRPHLTRPAWGGEVGAPVVGVGDGSECEGIGGLITRQVERCGHRGTGCRRMWWGSVSGDRCQEGEGRADRDRYRRRAETPHGVIGPHRSAGVVGFVRRIRGSTQSRTP